MKVLAVAPPPDQIDANGVLTDERRAAGASRTTRR